MALSTGVAIFTGAVAGAAALFALALRRRSWSLWLTGYGVLILTLGVSWFVRRP